MRKSERDQLLKKQLAKVVQPPESEFSPEELSSLRLFAEASGVRPEGSGGRAFSLSDRLYLQPLYDEQRENPRRRLVIMKSAQMGLTIRMFYRALWWTADANRLVNTTLFFPTGNAVKNLSKTRFRPMVSSSPRILKLVKGGLEPKKKRQRKVDSAEVITIGVSNMRFHGMNSGIEVDSTPVDVLLFDEVRLMERPMIERAFARVSDSQFVGPDGTRGFIELNSTAGFPNSDIHYYFEQSTQNHWHTPCPNMRCDNHSGFIMAKEWPDCVDEERMRYICPKCGTEIPNTQTGFYHALGPTDAEWDGYAFNQIMKGNAHLPVLWRAFERMVIRGGNPTEFRNSYLGLPHFDPEKVLVSAEDFEAAQQLEPDYRWPEAGENPEGWVTSMGIDQRPGELHVSILRKSRNGRVYLAHLEVVELSGDEAVNYCVALARRWRADIVVVDSMPSYDLASDIGRNLGETMVWLAEYGQKLEQPIVWSDHKGDKSFRRTSGEIKYRSQVRLDRYKHLLMFLTLWRKRELVLPSNLAAKVQELNRDGRRVPVYLGFELKRHLENIIRASILKTQRDPHTGMSINTGQYHLTFRHGPVDPHFVHSMGYAYAGLMRESPKGQIILPGLPKQETSQDPYMQQLKEQNAFPKLPSRQETCGTCQFVQAEPDSKEGKCSNKYQMDLMNYGKPLGVQLNLVRCRYYRRAVH